MLQITGKVVNIYTNEGGKDKEGKEYSARHKVQLLGAVDLPNGDVKQDLVDLTVEDLKEWQLLNGKNITVDIGAFAPSKGNIIFFIKKGSKPSITGNIA